MTEIADQLRLGVTATRKIGNAVARNRARRRLRAAAREVLPALAMPGFDYVLIARQATLQRPFVQLVADVRSGLQRLGVLRRAARSPR